MQEMLLELIGEYGNLAVFLLIFIENLFPPIPSEVVLLFGGVMTACTKLRVAGVIGAATAGSVLGAVILYQVGRLIPEEILERAIAGRLGKLLRLQAEDVALAKGWFRKKGKAAVFICRMIPLVRSLISIPAGLAGLRMGPFLFLTASGSLIWNTALVCLGRAAGNSWEKASAAFGLYSDLFLMVLGSTAVLAALIWQAQKEE
ncbi:MAG: DedA family protein [Lachnospiraceae bacterium]|nr:DedA family protein [Lachnospiraceae bacterium]